MVWLIFPCESVTNAKMIGPPCGRNQHSLYSESVDPKRLLWKPRGPFSELVRNDVLCWNDYIGQRSYINRVNKLTWKDRRSFHVHICAKIDNGQARLRETGPCGTVIVLQGPAPLKFTSSLLQSHIMSGSIRLILSEFLEWKVIIINFFFISTLLSSSLLLLSQRFDRFSLRFSSGLCQEISKWPFI